MSVQREHGRYVPTCDNCEDTLSPQDSFEEAREAMADADWVTRKKNGEWVNYCTECQ